ncbi:transposase [Myxococcota bacterium]|nr:transposase [Myxococcota bacterium]
MCKQLSEQVSSVIIKYLDAQGVLEGFKEQDPLLEKNLPLAHITGASIGHRIALGENAPNKVHRILQDPHEGQRSGHLCFSSSGFSLHAATHIPAWDRKRLFNLCCYIARPPLSNESLRQLPNGDLTFKLKTRGGLPLHHRPRGSEALPGRDRRVHGNSMLRTSPCLPHHGTFGGQSSR